MQTDQQLRAILTTVMPGGPSDLCEFAAHHAINELICNWSAALNQGHKIDALLNDVDSVIEILGQFKAKCASSGSLQNEASA